MSMADRDGFIWYDGKLVPWRDATTHVLTHSLHYGMGVFEGVRAYKTEGGTAIFRLNEHTDRLFTSAETLGMKIPFTKDQVKWVVVPFNSSYAPGPKTFDFDINQISISPARAKAVGFSTPYYTAPQAVLALKGTPAASATSLADLRDAKIGVQIGTTSLSDVKTVIRPTQQPQVFNDSNDTVRALKNKSVDAIVVDAPTAIYLRDFEVKDSVVVGKFAGTGTPWGVVMQKDSTLISCVNQAIDKLRKSGELATITNQWMGPYTKAPELS